MEMEHLNNLLNQSLMFKIDLIVWKYNIDNLIYRNICEFKIDLIVWKFINSETVASESHV